MKKILLMTLSVMFFGTVANAKVHAAEAEDGVEAVDLGLSVKWASMNVGAKKDSGFVPISHGVRPNRSSTIPGAPMHGAKVIPTS